MPHAKTNQQFIEDAKKVHSNKYTYKHTNYRGRSEQVVITCRKHGDFSQTAFNHLLGKGCTECKKETLRNLKSKGVDQFIKEARKAHGNKYDYSKVEYINGKQEVTIICSKHGEFSQVPTVHRKGHGCPKCKYSIGEKAVADFLNSAGICFEVQKKFPECRDKYKLTFDFFFQHRGVRYLIEYQGKQHYKPIRIFTLFGKEKLEWFQRHDTIKRKFAKEYGFTLIEIPYTVKDVSSYLASHLNLYRKQA